MGIEKKNLKYQNWCQFDYGKELENLGQVEEKLKNEVC
jgi:hypothetical protein